MLAKSKGREEESQTQMMCVWCFSAAARSNVDTSLACSHLCVCMHLRVCAYVCASIYTHISAHTHTPRGGVFVDLGVHWQSQKTRCQNSIFTIKANDAESARARTFYRLALAQPETLLLTETEDGERWRSLQ